MSNTFDQEFIDMMVPHHRAGIEMARLAEERAEHASLQTLATDMISAQSAEIRRMEQCRSAARSSASAREPAKGSAQTMGMKKMDMPDVMRDLRSADSFDKAFLAAMIPHHEMAIDMAKPATDKAELPELKELAQQICQAQGEEVTQMKRWLREWK